MPVLKISRRIDSGSRCFGYTRWCQGSASFYVFRFELMVQWGGK